MAIKWTEKDVTQAFEKALKGSFVQNGISQDAKQRIIDFIKKRKGQ